MQEGAEHPGGQYARVFKKLGYKNPTKWEEEQNKKKKKKEKKDEKPIESATPKFDSLIREYGPKFNERGDAIKDCITKCIAGNIGQLSPDPRNPEFLALIKVCVDKCANTQI
jgi:hypothetical protein